jgi:tetratricopeptide (TPR) repeat protein
LNARTLEIHRLVQAVLKQGMDEATQRSWAERVIRAVNPAFPLGEFSNWAGCERLLPQAHACAELINQWGFEFLEAALLLNNAGLYLWNRGRYTDAESLYERALTIFEKALGPQHPDIAKHLNYLAVLYGRQGRNAEAEPLLKRALAIQEKALWPDHPDLAWSLNNLGALYGRQGRHGEAECLHKQALAIREKALVLWPRPSFTARAALAAILCRQARPGLFRPAAATRTRDCIR